MPHEFHEDSVGKITGDEVFRHMSPAQSCFEQVVLRAEFVHKPPTLPGNRHGRLLRMGWLSVTTIWICRLNSSRAAARPRLASGCEGAQTVTIRVSHSQCLSSALGFSSGTSAAVIENTHSPSRTSASPPFIVVMRKFTTAVGASRPNRCRQAMRCLRG